MITQTNLAGTLTDSDIEKFQSVMSEMRKEYKPTSVCIDVANGYSEPFLDFVKSFRKEYPKMIIMAGNVVTAEMTEALILARIPGTHT